MELCNSPLLNIIFLATAPEIHLSNIRTPQDLEGWMQHSSKFPSVKTALALVYKALIPLDPQPQGLKALMARFRNGRAAQSFIRTQLVSGATYALAFVHRRHPYLILRGIEEVPNREDGGPTPMDTHYRAVEDVAVKLIRKLERDTEMYSDYVAPLVPKDEPVD